METGNLPTVSGKNSVALRVTNRYGDFNNFLSTFRPDMLIRYTNERKKCFMGTAPSLVSVKIAYGDNVAESWIMGQLKAFCKQCNVRTELDVNQLENMAKLILGSYPYLKCTEFMYFIRMCMIGYYGKYFGVLESVRVMEDLMDFAFKYRRRVIEQYEQEDKYED